MEVVALTKSVRISPRKVSLVAGTIRNQSVEKALSILVVTKKRASTILLKIVKSAVANAKNNAKLQTNNLVIAKVEVMEGPVLKRFHPTSRGRTHPYKKRSTHIRVVLREKGDK